MAAPILEVADIFRGHGAAWREANPGHVSLGQLKVMSAIENCRTAALGGHVARCENATAATRSSPTTSCSEPALPEVPGCGGTGMAGASARPSCLPRAILHHVVFTLPAAIARHRLPEQGRDLRPSCSRPRPETMLKIAADPKHLGASIGFIAVLHTWGSAMTHHPHVHMIVPGGGLSPDGGRWIACRRQASSCRSACSRGCSGVLSLTFCSKLTGKAAYKVLR